MTTSPFVTVAVPVLNEASYIDRVLQAIVSQDYPADRMEIIIADGLSTDGTQEIIQRYLHYSNGSNGTSYAPIRVITNPKQIVSTGLNEVIRQANGEIIVRVDAHTIIEPDYVRQCVCALLQSGADGVGGPMTSVGQGYVAEAIALATSTPFAIGNSVYRTSRFFKERYVETTHMGAYRKETLLKVGLFNEQFVRHQDYELDYRIRQAGGAILLSPHIRSHYYVRGRLQKLWRQYFQYGFWKGQFIRQSSASLKWRHTIPPLFVLGLFLLLGLAIAGSSTALIGLGGLLATYLIFITLGAFYACRQRANWKYMPILPLIFACVHMAWGAGIWPGLLLPDALLPQRWPR
jgi:succinoglycan biosynthesis protein ExoA